MELLQIATAFLLQSATRFIINCGRCYKSAMNLLPTATGITKWDDYNKLRQYIRFNILSPWSDIFIRIIELG